MLQATKISEILVDTEASARALKTGFFTVILI